MFSNLVWVQQGNQFIKGRISGNNKYFDEQGKEISGSQVYERCESVVDDMIQLQVLNDPQLLYNISNRYTQDLIFTYVGPTLLVVNPFKFLPGELEYRRMFIQKVIKEGIQYKSLLPHTFAVTANAFTKLHQKNQAIVISGESGAGKTENARYCMNLLTAINSEQDELSGKIIGCNPILEAFGNAKTVRNKNSSRFGKYSRLIVEKQNIIGADIINYLLEKSRVIKQSKNNRNFHIFYLFLNGVSDLQSYGLNLQQQFKYLPPSDYEFKEEHYQELVDAFTTVGINYKTIFRVVAAILLIGELTFSEPQEDNQPCKIKNGDCLKQICTLLEIEEIEKALTQKVRVIGKETIYSPLNKKDCDTIRDSWAKELYSTLFDWIVGEMNKTLSSGKKAVESYIGLLDIYGFEVFDENGFEQMMINYTNERLHQLYIEYVFKEEKKIFVAEGLGQQVEKIKFDDNTSVIDLFDKAPICLFNLIDQASKLNQTDQTLLSSFRKELKFPSNLKPIFTIKHTAKNVDYTCSAFVEKNMDETPALLLQVKSKLPMIQLKPKPKSICSKIKQEIKELMTELSDCGVHFIRCIKPNDELVADKLDIPYTMKQIQYLGVLDSLKVRKINYPIRVDYHQFHQKYGELYSHDANHKEESQKIMEKFKINQDLYLLGNTQIFIQESGLEELDKEYQKAMAYKIEMAKRIQKAYKCYKFKVKFKKFMKTVHKISNKIMRIKKHMQFKKKLKAAYIIQKYYREYQIQKKRKLYKQQIRYLEMVFQTYSIRQKTKYQYNAILKIQHSFKIYRWKSTIQRRIIIKQYMNTILQIEFNKLELQSALIIQTNYRGYITRKHHYNQVQKIQEAGRQVKIQKKVKTIQKWARGHIVRVRLKKMHSAAYYIQGYFRMRFLSDVFQRMRMAAIYIQRRFRETMPKKRIYRELFQQFIEPLRIQYEKQKQKEEEDLYQEMKEYEDVLFVGMESMVQQKMYLFSFILDVEILQDTSDCFTPTYTSCFRSLFLKTFQKEHPIQTLHVGDTFAFALCHSKVYGWGLNDLSQLGMPPDGDIHGPTLLNIPGRVKSMTTGSNHCTILQDDKLYFWGTAENRTVAHPIQLAEQVTMAHSFRDRILYIKCGILYDQMRPIKLQYKVQSMSAGADFVIVQVENGQLYAYGNNDRGQLGMGDRQRREQPSRVNLSDKVLLVQCGYKHVICLTTLKKVFTWGWGEYGQLGTGLLQDAYLPQNLMIFADQVSAGYRCSYLISKMMVFAAGTNAIYFKQGHFNLMKQKCQYLNRKEYHIIRVMNTFSKNISVTYLTYGCTKGVFDNNHSKAQKVCHTIGQKWIDQNSSTMDPPFIESVSNYLCEKHQQKNRVMVGNDMQQRKKRIAQLNRLPKEKLSEEDVNFILNYQ